MANQVTISTHNGSTVAVGHNLRDPSIVAHEPHIDPDGPHETWHHEDLREFYDRTFGAAQAEYDAKQNGRESRMIGNYLDKLTEDAAEAEAENEKIRERNKRHKAAGEKQERLKVAKKPVYEMICGVYGQDGLQIPQALQREILLLYIMGDGTDAHPSWQQRNPGLQVVGAYYHGDEPDAGDHVHLDYVPVARCPRGMAVQNSLEGALNSQGIRSGKVEIDGKKVFRTAQMQFEAAENAYFQSICEEYGYEVLHPQRGNKSTHRSTAELKREAAMDAREKAVADREAAADVRDAALNARESALQLREHEVKEQAEELYREREGAKMDRLHAKEDRQAAADALAGVDSELDKRKAEVKRLRVFVDRLHDQYSALRDGIDAATFAADLVEFAKSRTNVKTGRSLYDDFLDARSRSRTDGQPAPVRRDIGHLGDAVERANAAMRDVDGLEKS